MQRVFLIALVSLCGVVADAVAAELDPHNTKAPFCFQVAGRRSWRITTDPLRDGERVHLQVVNSGQVVADGDTLEHAGLRISVSREGRLQVAAPAGSEEVALLLRLSVAGAEPQEVQLRAAPPARPISYIADLVDDLIHTFHDAGGKRFRPISQGAFDQYFRRLQAHGVHRLIVWHSPFPYFTRPADHEAEHWDRYAGQARAIVDSGELETAFQSVGGLPNWMWLRFILEMRLNPDAGPMFVRSAAEHGIALTASFRPFESALTKYYEVPTFDSDGRPLWGFLPLAVPAVNYAPETLCFGHYREILAAAGKPDMGLLGTIELPGVTNVDELVQQHGPAGGFEVRASAFAPIASDSFVLVRQPAGGFELVRYETIRARDEAQQRMLPDLRLTIGADGIAQLTGVDVSSAERFLILTHPGAAKANLALDRQFPLRLRSRAGNRMHRETIYWVLDESAPGGKECRISGITPDGEYRAVFQANQNSISQLLPTEGPVPLAGNSIAIDLGAPWSVEMLDCEQPATRAMAVTQMRTLLQLEAAGDPFAGDATPRPVYDELFINTRSHVDLAPSYADGVDGQMPIAHYYRTGRRYLHHLGLDKAYAPRSVAGTDSIRTAAMTTQSVEQITTWQDAEWRDPCQDPSSPFIWRLARNEGVGRGVTLLAQDFERAFPGLRIRAVVPPRQPAIERIQSALESMPDKDGVPYGRDYYQRLWCSNNHIPTIGEGMALIDLTGTRIEPVFLGSGGYLPEPAPFEMFVDEQIVDMADNHGSSFRGPRSYFFEAQFTLRDPAAREHRERMICELLGRQGEIGDVLLYEATDWLHTLPLDDPDYCSHAFTTRCAP